MAEVKDRPKILKGATHKVDSGCGVIYVTINELNNQTFEVFINHGRCGRCSNIMMGAIGVTISHGLRAGVPLGEFAKALFGFRCDMAVNAVQNKGIQIQSCIDAVAKVFTEYLTKKNPDMAVVAENIPGPEPESFMAAPISKPRDGLDILEDQVKELIGGSSCEVCGGAVVRQEGCEKCVVCGHSQKCGGA